MEKAGDCDAGDAQKTAPQPEKIRHPAVFLPFLPWTLSQLQSLKINDHPSRAEDALQKFLAKKVAEKILQIAISGTQAAIGEIIATNKSLNNFPTLIQQEAQ